MAGTAGQGRSRINSGKYYAYNTSRVVFRQRVIQSACFLVGHPLLYTYVCYSLAQVLAQIGVSH